jgi:hypothetical protein
MLDLLRRKAESMEKQRWVRFRECWKARQVAMARTRWLEIGEGPEY